MLVRSLLIAVLTALTSTAYAQIDPESGDVYVPPEEGGTVPPETGGGGVVIDLQVTSTPEGAQVIADRQVIGVTPLDTQVPISNPSTRMRVTVQHPGYQPHTFEVDPNRPSHSVHAALVPIGDAAPGEGEPGAGGGGMSLEYGPRPTHEIRGLLGFYTINNDNPAKFTELMLDLSGRFRLLGTDEESALTLDLEAQWSAFVAFAQDFDPEARPNNPNVYVTAGTRFGVLRVWGGLGLALPVAAAIDENGIGGFAGLAGRLISGGMRGFIEPWNYQSSHIGIHGRGGLEARFQNGSVGAEMAFGGMPGIEANYSPVPTYFAWQLRLFGEARPIDLLSFGGQFGIVYLKDLDNGFGFDDVFVSLEPSVRFHFGPGFVGARFLLNFTDTSIGGFSFDDNGIWSLSVDGGVNLE